MYKSKKISSFPDLLKLDEISSNFEINENDLREHIHEVVTLYVSSTKVKFSEPDFTATFSTTTSGSSSVYTCCTIDGIASLPTKFLPARSKIKSWLFHNTQTFYDDKLKPKLHEQYCEPDMKETDEVRITISKLLNITLDVHRFSTKNNKQGIANHWTRDFYKPVTVEGEYTLNTFQEYNKN